MAWEKMFTRYGSPSKEADIRLTAYLLHPEGLTQDKITYYDGVAQRAITEAQALIDSLGEYRQALAARYNQLETGIYHHELKLERHPPSSYSKVKYYLTLSKIYEDGTNVTELNERYEGKQRREALARFEELKKQRPGIKAILDIEKRSWER